VAGQSEVTWVVGGELTLYSLPAQSQRDAADAGVQDQDVERPVESVRSEVVDGVEIEQVQVGDRVI